MSLYHHWLFLYVGSRDQTQVIMLVSTRFIDQDISPTLYIHRSLCMNLYLCVFIQRCLTATDNPSTCIVSLRQGPSLAQNSPSSYWDDSNPGQSFSLQESQDLPQWRQLRLLCLTGSLASILHESKGQSQHACADKQWNPCLLITR